jgi:uncharacterized protein YPO0396
MWNSLWTFISPLTVIINLLKEIKVNQAELAEKLEAVNTTLVKVRVEVVGAVADLKAAIEAAQTVDPALQAVVAKLEGTAKALDDLNPDPAPAPQPE